MAIGKPVAFDASAQRHPVAYAIAPEMSFNNPAPLPPGLSAHLAHTRRGGVGGAGGGATLVPRLFEPAPMHHSRGLRATSATVAARAPRPSKRADSAAVRTDRVRGGRGEPPPTVAEMEGWIDVDGAPSPSPEVGRTGSAADGSPMYVPPRGGSPTRGASGLSNQAIAEASRSCSEAGVPLIAEKSSAAALFVQSHR